METPPQALVYGDNRPYSVALVYPDWGLLRAWAEKNAGAKEGMSLDDLASIEAVRHLIAGEIAIALEGFKKFEVRSYSSSAITVNRQKKENTAFFSRSCHVWMQTNELMNEWIVVLLLSIGDVEIFGASALNTMIPLTAI